MKNVVLAWTRAGLLACSTIAMLFASPSLYAQETAAGEAAVEDQDEKAEEIIVTGSRIGRSNLEEFAHISVVSTEQITMSSTQSVGKLLVEMPSVTLQGTNQQTNNGGSGAVYIDLRNLGSNRTLVLVNGHRFMASSSGGAVDMNNIPVAMIDRVEVLLDGASAAYGSDAVGGVVNIILKDDFEGVAADLSMGTSIGGGIGEPDGEEITASVTMGTAFDRGNFMANASYTYRGAVWHRDRAWTAKPVVIEFLTPGDPFQIYGSSTHPGGHVSFEDGQPIDVYFTNKQADGGFGDLQMLPWTNAFDANVRYDYSKEMFLLPGMERLALTTVGNYEVVDNVKMYMEGSYVHRTSRTRFAPVPLGLTGTDFYPGAIWIPTTNPYVPDELKRLMAPGTTLIPMHKRMTQLGARVWDHNSEGFRVLAGAKADLTEDFNLDVFVNWSSTLQTTTIYNAINYARMYETLDPVICAQNAHRGCEVGNYFGDDPALITQGVRNYILHSGADLSDFRQLQVGASVAGRVLELPAGDLGIAFGAETRKLGGAIRPNPINVSGDDGEGKVDPAEGTYNAQEVFAELNVPLLRNMPGFYSVELDLSARFSHFSSFGNDITYRAGLSWAPIRSLKFRGTYSTAFRAPTIGDLYGGKATSYIGANDPCNNYGANDNATLVANCSKEKLPNGDFLPADFDQNAVGGVQFRATTGSNQELEAETARVITGGMVISSDDLPEFLDGLYITADYYNIVVNDAIDSPNLQYILDSCYRSENKSHDYCTRISDRLQSGLVKDVQLTLANISKYETQGIDFTVGYGLPLSVFGLSPALRLNAAVQGNYLMNFDKTIEGAKDELVDTISADSGSYTSFRWNLMAGVSGESWNFSNRIRYVKGADIYEALIGEWPTTSIPDVVYWDLVFQLNWEDMYLVVGMDNVLNKEPPKQPKEGGQNANVQTYDTVGRYVFTKVGYKF